MARPLDSARSMLARARHHTAEFEAQLVIYREARAFKPVIEKDPESGQNILKIKMEKPIPEGLENIACDAVSNFRASLDQVGYAVAMAANPQGKGKDTYFPFGDTPAEVKSRHSQGSKEIPNPIFDLMMSFCPYQGGDDLLWALNKLANSNKHRFLIPVAVKAGGINGMDVEAVNNGPMRIAMSPEWDRDKNEMELARWGGEGKFRYNVDVAFDIAFTEIGAISGLPALAVLHMFDSKVDGVLMAVEAEALRLGIFK